MTDIRDTRRRFRFAAELIVVVQPAEVRVNVSAGTGVQFGLLDPRTHRGLGQIDPHCPYRIV